MKNEKMKYYYYMFVYLFYYVEIAVISAAVFFTNNWSRERANSLATPISMARGSVTMVTTVLYPKH